MNIHYIVIVRSRVPSRRFLQFVYLFTFCALQAMINLNPGLTPAKLQLDDRFGPVA